MTYCFDIDGTLCTNTNGDYERAQPFPDAIRRVNGLFDAGHEIVLFTARGGTTGLSWEEVTKRQLAAWGVKYTRLAFGKPFAQVYIDDRAVNTRDWQRDQALDDPKRRQAGGGEKIVARAAYLDVTYSPEKEKYTDYPDLLARWLLDHVYRSPGQLLDIGCGRGEHMAAFRRLGFDPVGLDISPRAPALAPDFRVVVADLEREPLPLPAGTFDYVFSKSVIEHLQQPTLVLEKALEALRPGGTAVIMTPSWRHSYWGPFYIDHTHVTPFTAPSLAEAMVMVGFQAVRVVHFYQLPFLWRYPFLKPVVKLAATLPLPYRPLDDASWPEGLNKFIRFSKEVMLLGVGRSADPRALNNDGPTAG